MACLGQVQELQSPLRDGWGICTDGASLIISDSSPTLVWLDPDTLQQQRSVEVHDGDDAIPWVNEVRCCRKSKLSVDGHCSPYALWQQHNHCIARWQGQGPLREFKTCPQSEKHHDLLQLTLVTSSAIPTNVMPLSAITGA